MKAQAIAVKLKEAEKTRKYLSEKNLLKKNLKIKHDEEYVYLPIEKVVPELTQYKQVKYDFEEVKIEPKSYKEKAKIPENLKQDLPTSYDVIGNIILIKLKGDLLNFKKEIGKSLLESNKKAKTVCLINPVRGELRTRDIEIIAGSKNTRTTHTEYDLKFEVDISKAYFSPRLANERKRIADLVKPGEIIADMFAGVAPFSIMIAQYAKPSMIYALDKNKNAVEYAKRNVKINNLLDKIEIIHADSKDIRNIFNKNKANRIIMNLPFSSNRFFKYALEIISDVCIIHYYEMLKEENISKQIDKLKKIAEKQNVSLSNFYIRKIKTYAPREFYIGIDITAKQMPM